MQNHFADQVSAKDALFDDLNSSFCAEKAHLEVQIEEF